MSDERRANNDKIVEFIGEAKTHIAYSNEIQRDYVIDRKDIYEKIEVLGNRQTTTETKQAGTIWGIRLIGVGTVTLLGKMVWKSLHP